MSLAASSAPLTHTTTVRVPADHPALPGHFPGRPIAPGVVLLELVLAAAERWRAQPLQPTSLPQVKFLAPLAPEQDADLQLTLSGDELRFAFARNGATLAQGVFRLASAQTA